MGIPSAPPSSIPVDLATSNAPRFGTYWVTARTNFPSGSSTIQDENWLYDENDGLFVNPSFENLTGNQSLRTPKLIWRNPTRILFKKSKSYKFRTKVLNINLLTDSSDDVDTVFSITTPWEKKIMLNTRVQEFTQTGIGYVNLFSVPNNDITSTDLVTYKATYAFGEPSYLQECQIDEIEFDIQGFVWFTTSTSSTTLITLTASKDGVGWNYYDDTNSYVWFDDISSNNSLRPIYKLENVYTDFSIPSNTTSGNYIAKYIDLAKFNLSFTYTKLTGSPTDGIEIYLCQEVSKNFNDIHQSGSYRLSMENPVLIASYTQSGSTFSSYFGLEGNQYLLITASQSQSRTIIGLSDINVSGGYHEGNNRQYITTNSNIFANPTAISPTLPGATFSAFVGEGNTYNATQSLDVNVLYSKIGNGKFRAGIWENGVWNSGWRFDELLYEMFSISNYFVYERGKIWQFIIFGPESSVSKFNVGDKISIGNIVAIDFNEERKLLKGYYSIIEKTTTTLTVEIINNFPLQRIERDSKNHRIYITKNVWLAGVFMNGYFTGIWNSGLFKGYPLLTEMFNSQWIDGKFDGGHFFADYYSVTFSNTYFSKGTKLGLSFSTPHKLNVGDDIYIQKDDLGGNLSYEGTASVTSVTNEYQLITDRKWISNYTQSETGTIYTAISRGLIQNFDFKSLNKSKLSSVDYLDSDAVFLYNSWIDVNYYTYSAVNIGRPNTLRNTISLEDYSSNNLYGYPTEDVLSSESEFRNSYNTQQQTYKLGTKYKIYDDFVGEASSFANYFEPTNVDPLSFQSLGWSYRAAATNSIVFSRSVETREENVGRGNGLQPWQNVSREMIVGSELQIDARGSGGVLNLQTPDIEVNFRNPSKIKKSRYSMIEFDLSRWSGNSAYYTSDDINITQPTASSTLITQPILHFDNLNVVKRDLNIGIAGTVSTTINATFLPIYENVNHILTPVNKKTEYFYNKTNLSLNFRGSGWYGSSTASIIIDNLKYYEVDMIPFFQYFTTNNINFGIETPYQAISPFIDYSDANFDFLDNVSIGLDSFDVQVSQVAISGVGAGIGFGSTRSGVSSGTFNQITEIPTTPGDTE